MRIIKEGAIPNIEYIFTCDYCGCEFAVTRHELYDENPYVYKNSYRCPTCGTPAYGAVLQEIIEEESGSTENFETSEL